MFWGPGCDAQHRKKEKKEWNTVNRASNAGYVSELRSLGQNACHWNSLFQGVSVSSREQLHTTAEVGSKPGITLSLVGVATSFGGRDYRWPHPRALAHPPFYHFYSFLPEKSGLCCCPVCHLADGVYLADLAFQQTAGLSVFCPLLPILQGWVLSHFLCWASEWLTPLQIDKCHHLAATPALKSFNSIRLVPVPFPRRNHSRLVSQSLAQLHPTSSTPFPPFSVYFPQLTFHFIVIFAVSSSPDSEASC